MKPSLASKSRISRITSISRFVLIAFSFVTLISHVDAQVRFKIPIFYADSVFNGNPTDPTDTTGLVFSKMRYDTLWFGYSVDATVCRDTLSGFTTHWTLSDTGTIIEAIVPPDRPDGTRFKFVSYDANEQACFVDASKSDIRKFTGGPQRDSLRFIQGADNNPVKFHREVLSWPTVLSQYFDSCRIRNLGGPAVNIEMTEQSRAVSLLFNASQTPSHSFRIVASGPKVPPPPVPEVVLSSPENGATDQHQPISLSWNPSAGAQSYSVQVSKGAPTFSGADLVVNNLLSGGSTTLALPGLSGNTTYFWRVAVFTDGGASYYQNPPYSFTTGMGEGFRIPIIFTDSLFEDPLQDTTQLVYTGVHKDTVWFGYHPSATLCRDTLEGFWSKWWPSDTNRTAEEIIPPPSPAGQDIRFVPAVSGQQVCFVDGAKSDIHPYTDPSRPDSFQIRAFPDNNTDPIAAYHRFVFHWPVPLYQYFDKCQLVSLGAPIVAADMRQGAHCQTRLLQGSIYMFRIVVQAAHTLPNVLVSSLIVQSGWNMVSVPVAPADLRKTTVFPHAISPSFSYQGSYQMADTMERGVGYWLKFGSVDSIVFNGGPVFEDTIDLHNGWNIVGSVTSTVALSGVSVEPPGLGVSRFYGYHGGYYTAATLEPGKAYWLKAYGVGKLIMSALAANMPKTNLRIVPTEEMPPSPPGELSSTTAPLSFVLSNNYPNPFNPTTVIGYGLPERSHVTLQVFNILGQAVTTLIDKDEDVGSKSIVWDASSLPSGVYYYRMQAKGNSGRVFTETRKMLIVK